MMQFVRKTMTGLSSCFLTRLPQSSHCKFVSSVSHLLVKVWSLARTVSSPPQTQNSRIVKLNCSTLIIQLHPLKLHRLQYCIEQFWNHNNSHNSISGACLPASPHTDQSISCSLLGLVFISSSLNLKPPSWENRSHLWHKIIEGYVLNCATFTSNHKIS